MMQDNMDNDVLMSIIKAAGLACSAGNSQPWQFDIYTDHIALSLNPTRVIDNDPYLRKALVSLGCALQNMIIQANSYNYQLIYDLETVSAHPVIRILLKPQSNSGKFIHERLDKIAVNRGMYDSSYELTPEDYLNLDRLHHFKEVDVLYLRDKNSQREFTQLIVDRANPRDKFKYFNTGSTFGCIAAKAPFDFQQLIQVGQLFVLLQLWALKNQLALQPVGCYMIGIFEQYREKYHKTAHLISNLFQNQTDLHTVMGFRLGKPMNIANQGTRLSLNEISKCHPI